MTTKLELVRDKKLYKLLPGVTKKTRLEASGVYVMDQSICYVIFDNLNEVARIDLSLRASPSNRLIPVVSVGTGFEDITYDQRRKRFYLIIEALEDTNGDFHGLVSAYGRDFTFRHCTMLDPVFQRQNKGFEGVGHLWRDDKEYLIGLWEDTVDQDDKEGHGRLYVFSRDDDGGWAETREIDLPPTAQFRDYAAIARRGNRVAVISQSSQKLWLGEINDTVDGFAGGTGTVYDFPDQRYCNVEGVSWISDDELVVVSDRRKKKKQPKCCADKDQSIHILGIPK